MGITDNETKSDNLLAVLDVRHVKNTTYNRSVTATLFAMRLQFCQCKFKQQFFQEKSKFVIVLNSIKKKQNVRRECV